MTKFVRISVIAVIIFVIIFACKSKSEISQNTNRRTSYPTVEKIRISQTGQKQCYSEISEIIPCAGTGQDGELKRGVAWPKPRFIVNRNGTITDRLTGLMWERTPLKRPVNWEEAFKQIGELNERRFAGYKDWRLPNIIELASLANFGIDRQYVWLRNQGFNVFQGQLSLFWSGTTDHIASKKDNSPDKYVYVFDLHNGSVGSGGKVGRVSFITTNLYIRSFVIGVRTTGQGVIKLPRTGQTKKYHVGDDGDLQMGVPIPKPRFIDNGNGTMTDRLTNLVWEKKPGNQKVNWEDALKRIKELNLNRYAGYNDWRLPNIHELLSLANYQIPLIKILKDEGFQLSNNYAFWSGTTEIGRINKNIAGQPLTGYSWYMYMSDGSIETREKINPNSEIYVIAVRGGS